MRHYSPCAILSLLSFALLTGCGGGGGGDTPTGSSNSNANNPPLTSGAGSPTTASGTTTTTIGRTTTTTAAGGTTTSTLAGTTTTTTTATSGTTTTTTSSTSTTAPSDNGSLPPLSSTRIALIHGAGGQQLGTTTWPDRYNGRMGETIDNVACNDWNQERNYFNHAHLSIFKNGERLAIPQYIGWSDPCIYDINTDNRNGVIDEVSANGYKFMSLGQFFALWGQPLSWTNVAGITGLPIVIYIEDSGVLSQYTGDPANIEIGNYRSITIQIGTPLSEIPTYDWNSYTGGE